jgi:hypothetical protein
MAFLLCRSRKVSLSKQTNKSLSTKLNLPPPKLQEDAPIPIQGSIFKKLLGTFRLTFPPDSINQRPHSQKFDISHDLSRLYAKIDTTISQDYLRKTLEPLFVLHPRPDSLAVVISATYLIISSQKDGQVRKVTTTERKQVIQVFDESFSSKELNNWISIIEKDLENVEWFELNPVKNVEGQKKVEHEVKQMKLTKDTSGIGIMVR